MLKCSAGLVLAVDINNKQHKWWLPEKFKMTSKMSANFTDYMRVFNQCVHIIKVDSGTLEMSRLLSGFPL